MVNNIISQSFLVHLKSCNCTIAVLSFFSKEKKPNITVEWDALPTYNTKAYFNCTNNFLRISETKFIIKMADYIYVLICFGDRRKYHVFFFQLQCRKRLFHPSNNLKIKVLMFDECINVF